MEAEEDGRRESGGTFVEMDEEEEGRPEDLDSSYMSEWQRELRRLSADIAQEAQRHREAVFNGLGTLTGSSGRLVRSPMRPRERPFLEALAPGDLKLPPPRKDGTYGGGQDQQEQLDGDRRDEREKDRRNVAYQANVNQSFFLRAVFDLIEAKLDWETQVLESLRLKYPELPASNEAIMYGYLKKSKSHHNLKPKFVVVSPGLLTFVNSSVESTGTLTPLLLFGKPHREKKEAVKSIRLLPGTRCRAVDKKSSSGKFYFEIVDSFGSTLSECGSPKYGGGDDFNVSGPGGGASGNGQTVSGGGGSNSVSNSEGSGKHSHGRLWAAPSAEDRLRWMKVIEQASELHERHISALDASELNRLHHRINGSKNENEYLAVLGDIFGMKDVHHNQTNQVSKTIDVPLEWVHEKLKLPRGGNQEDAAMEQIFKDMQRDKVYINDKLFSGWTDHGRTTNSASGGFAGPAICSIVCALAGEIQDFSNDVYLTEAEALALSHQVLLCCNRTQSGGNTLDAVTLLCGHQDFAIVATDSGNVEPLSIRVYNHMGLHPLPPPKISDGPTPQVIHRQTSSDGDFPPIRTRSGHSRTSSSPPMEMMAPAIVAENSGGPPLGARHQRAGSSGSHKNFNQKLLQGDIIKSISKIRHRSRRSSEPPKGLDELAQLAQLGVGAGGAGLPSAHSNSISSGENEFSLHDPGPRVDVQVVMHYRLLNPNFDDEADAVWANITATYKRTFALVGQRKTVALGQGSVSLRINHDSKTNKQM